MTEINSIHARLKEFGHLPDEQIPIVQTLILIGAAELAIEDIKPYENLIVSMHDAMNIIVEEEKQKSVTEDISLQRLNAMRRVIHEEFFFTPEHESYEEPKFMNFTQVLTRRAGIPVALGSLYLELGLRQGWDVTGLSFPGHFLIRMGQGASRVIMDPFQGHHKLIPLQAPDLRALLKKVVDEKAELHHDYFNSVTNRDVVLRLCNNRKTRLIRNEEYQEAINLIELQMMMAPNDTRLLFDAGMVVARLQQIQRSVGYLEAYIASSTDKDGIAIAKNTIFNLQRLLQ